MGGLLSWIIPDRVIQEALKSDSRIVDVSAFFVATVLSTQIGFYIVDSANFGFMSILGSISFGVIGLILLLIYTSVWEKALNTSKVKGNLLVARYSELYICHLYICPIMLAFLLTGVITENPTVLFVLFICVARTVDLQARVVRAVCRIEYAEALKGTVMIAVVWGGMMSAIAWVITRFI
ncbi:MAG: hypothetical protein V3R57_08075 [Candidatus Bathyarchaeia archaeon]